MNNISSYKDLKVWQNGIKLVKLVYDITLLEHQKFVLTPQIQRCSVSVPSNIAEGWGRNGNKEFIRFLRISKGSLYELETQLIICNELEYIDQSVLETIQNLITEESKMLQGLITSIKNKNKKECDN